MVFEKIKEYFKQKKEKEQIFFAVKLVGEEGVCYVVDKKTAEIMIVGDWTLQGLKNCDFVERKGKVFAIVHGGNPENYFCPYCYNQINTETDSCSSCNRKF